MKKLTLALAFVFVATGGVARAGVSVSFVDPGHYTDASLYGRDGAAGRVPAEREIAQTLTRLGERYLRPSQTLAIWITDIDLAGRFEPWRPLAVDVRFMREITWPRIKLRYVLTEPGEPPRSGDETVRDQTYLMHPAIHTGETMPYEKAMLADWFRARFADSRVSGR